MIKHLLITLFALCAAQLSYAQDSLQVTFSEEKDTLVKQRFIDRYENVFMMNHHYATYFFATIRFKVNGKSAYQNLPLATI